MKDVYFHESKINRSEGRLFVTTSPGKKTTLLCSELFWLNDTSSKIEARIKINWYCERYNYNLVEYDNEHRQTT